MLLGRRAECEALDGLIADAAAGQSRVVVLRGEAGVGKSALVRYLTDRVDGWTVATAVGVESEMELAYGSLHQLCARMLDRIDRLAAPQRNALAIVFGQSAGPPPDRFLVGLATLSLFAEVAEERPLLCVVDDAQWLDQASAQILGFVARRLLAERVAVVCATRSGTGDDVFAGLPEVKVAGIDDPDARALLLANVHGPLDAAVSDQIIAESHGNPLALLELPRTWTAVDLAGGFGLPGTQPVTGKIERSYVRRIEQLPEETRLFLLIAAAEPLGDPVLMLHAAQTLGVHMTAADPAVDAGLLTLGARVEFAHPLVRSAAYHSATAEERHRVHCALAGATDPDIDPDRRAWHRARATPGPDEEIAVELERSADRARARGGVAAAAAFLQQALVLTEDPARRTERALAAAHASLQAGALDAAFSLVSTSESGRLDEVQRARTDLLRAQIAFAQKRAADAPGHLLEAARRFEAIDVATARDIYLDAISAGILLGRMAGSVGVEDVARAAAAAAPHEPPRPADLLLNGFATRFTEGYAAAAPILKQAVAAYVDGGAPADDELQRLWLACHAAWHVWDDRAWEVLASRHVALARKTGSLTELPFALSMHSAVRIFVGELDVAASLNHERQTLSEAIGSRFPPFADLVLAAWSGREADAVDWDGAVLADWARALLLNGAGRYREAAAAAERASERAVDVVAWTLGLVELVMAAARAGERDRAADAFERLSEIAQASGSEWALGIEARSRALLDSDDPEPAYRESIDRLARTRVRSELGRTHLLYGEWLRRENRRVDARAQLRAAHDMLREMGMQSLAERARRELAATGEKVRARSADTRDQLTPQEEQIARLARDGLSNPEIGATLFLSPRTVEWHLRKVFTKLGISSRTGLRTAMPARDHEAAIN